MVDVIIIGAGPAGLCAGIYAKRAGYTVELMEGYAPGGQVVTTAEVENYLGFDHIDGVELAIRFAEHAAKNGLEIQNKPVTSVDFAQDSPQKCVYCGTEAHFAKTVILASGAKRRLLGIEGEARLTGRGVSYCANCDGSFFKGKVTAVIGGGDTALEDAIYLARLCKKVYLIHRRDQFRAAQILIERVKQLPSVELVYDSVAMEICGGKKVESLLIKNGKTNAVQTLAVDGVFVAVGTIPETAFLPPELEKSEDGYLITDELGMTNLSGIFAAGDIRKKPLRQIVTAVADGAVAAYGVSVYLNQK